MLFQLIQVQLILLDLQDYHFFVFQVHLDQQLKKQIRNHQPRKIEKHMRDEVAAMVRGVEEGWTYLFGLE